jgi:hypothetical protein
LDLGSGEICYFAITHDREHALSLAELLFDVVLFASVEKKQQLTVARIYAARLPGYMLPMSSADAPH